MGCDSNLSNKPVNSFFFFSPFWQSQDIDITQSACIWLEDVQWSWSRVSNIQKRQKQKQTMQFIVPFSQRQIFYWYKMEVHKISPVELLEKKTSEL